MERLLSTDFLNFVRIQAYADDIALSIAAPNRNLLIARNKEAHTYVLDWETSRGLNFSPTKSSVVPGCSLVPGFSIPFGENSIRSTSSTRYFGIVVD